MSTIELLLPEIYLVYGLSLLLLGAMVLARPADTTEIPKSGDFWLIGLFGVLHGGKESLFDWLIAHSKIAMAQDSGVVLHEFAASGETWLAPALMIASYLPLFEFGRRHAVAWSGERPALRLVASPFIYLTIAGFVALLASLAEDPLAGVTAAGRYFLAFPGGVLTGIALLRAFPFRSPAIPVLGGAFIAYGVFGGLVMAPVQGLPNWLFCPQNFTEIVGLPVQVFRLACALAALIAFAIIFLKASRLSSARLLAVSEENRRLAVELEQRVTARTQELERERDLSTALFEATPAIIVLLTPEGRIHYINPFMERWSGFTLAEVRGMAWFDVFIPDRDRDAVRAPFAGAVSEQSATRGNINPILTHAGKERLVEWSDAVISADGDNERLLLAIGVDVTERTAAQDLLERERAQLRSILDGIPVVVTLYNLEGFQLAGNRALAKASGQPNAWQNMIGAHFRDGPWWADQPAQLEKYSAAFAKAAEGHTEHLTHAFDRLNGKTKITQMTVIAPYKNTGGKVVGVVSSTIDISDRAEAQNALQKQQERFQDFAEQSSDLLWELDADFRLTYISSGRKDLFGLNSEKFLGLHYTDLEDPKSTPEQRAQWQAVKTAIENRRAYQDLPLTVQEPNGAILHLITNGRPILDEDGQFVGFRGSSIDISAIIESQSIVAQSEINLNEAQRIAGLGSWELDLQKNELRWSDQIYRKLGLKRADHPPTYETFLGFVHPDDREAVNAAYLGAVESRMPYQIVHRLLLTDGSIKWVEERAETIYGASGDPIYSRGTALDITPLKEAQNTVEASLREKEILLREIHHRVKNNLQIIASLLYFQGQKIQDPESQEGFQEVRSRLNAMVLVHERLYRSNDLTSVEFLSYAQTLVEELGHLYRERNPLVAYDVSGPEFSATIETALPLGMILTELVSNAYKHAFAQNRPGLISITFRIEKGCMKMIVKDDGVGMPPNFDPEQADTFGWRLVRALTEQIDGALSFTSDTGAEITIAFPGPAA